MRAVKRTSLIVIAFLLLVFLMPELHGASQTTCPTCGASAIERVIKSSSEVKVACKVYKVNYEQIEISCTKNPKHVTTYAKTEVSRTLLREEHTYKTETDTKTESVEKTGCKVYTVSYKRTRSKCSVCGATTSWSGWTETGSTFSNYNHRYVTETETDTGTVQSGCSVYDVTKKRTRSVCSKCGDATAWSSWTETGRTFSHYSHLYELDVEYDYGTDKVGCSVYDITLTRSRNVCSRCGSATSWSAWKETKRTFSHYEHDLINDTESKSEEIKEGCKVYKINYSRMRQKCRYCDYATNWSAWEEVGRTLLREEHSWITDTETKTEEEKDGCSVYSVKYTRTRERCRDCNKVTDWSNWQETSRTFLRNEHDLINDTESKTEEVKEGCKVYKINFARMRKKCRYCDYTTAWSAWEEVDREYLREEHSWTTETEEKTEEYRVECDIFDVKYTRTRERCKDCNKVTEWTDWQEVSRVFKEKRHNYRTVTEERTQEKKEGCAVYLVKETRTREECLRCGDVSGDWSAWQEVSRELLRYEHNLDFDGVDHTEEEYEWRGNEYWKIMYAYPRYRCLNCGAIIIGERAVASQELQYKDTAGPTVSISDGYTGEWVGKVDVTITATDTQSGVKSVHYSWSLSETTSGGWTEYGSRITYASGGTWYLHYKAEDKAGNQTVGKTGPYKIDRTPPTVTITPSSDTGWIYEIVADAKDDQSGVKRIFYKWGKTKEIPELGEWSSWASTTSPYCRIVPPENGKGFFVILVVEDKAQITALKYGGPYDVDKLPPVIDSIQARFDNHGFGEQTYNYKVEVDIKASTPNAPNDSGLHDVRWYWQKDTETVPPYDDWTIITKRLDEEVTTGKNEPGNWTLHIMAVNNAGLTVYAKTKTYTLYDDAIHVMITPLSQQAWAKGVRVELEIIREHENANPGEHPDPGEYLWWPDLIFSWHQVYENGQMSLRSYYHDPACKGKITWAPNGEFYISASVKSFSGNVHTNYGGPYRVDSVAPYITLMDSYRDNNNNRVNLEIEIGEYAPTEREYYIVLAEEEMYNEEWQYEKYLLLSGDEGSFWAKRADVENLMIFDGNLVTVQGKRKISPYGGAECVWSQTSTPPSTGWTACEMNYTTRKSLSLSELWYHHVKTWDATGNTRVRTFGPYQGVRIPPPPPPPPDYDQTLPPTAKIYGPTKVIVGEAHVYQFTGRLHTRTGAFMCGNAASADPYYLDVYTGSYGGMGYSFSQNVAFYKTGQQCLYVTVEDGLGRTAQDVLWVQVVEPEDLGYLTANLTPYHVRHGDSLTVYAHSSVPSPWVEVKGQTVTMTPEGSYWIAHIPVQPSWPLGQNFLTVKNSKASVELDFIIEEDPPEANFLEADLAPYYVKHGEMLTVYALSSVPSPWVEVKGQTIAMTSSGNIWIAQVSVLPTWPLGQNFLTVKNGKASVELDFVIVDENTNPPRVPRSRIIQ